ncbi:MAG: hypothetical protein KKB79_00870 [Nanoarchaeota archaeon]|nr:hypothetical protein [Nanoarchaeota archaeon]
MKIKEVQAGVKITRNYDSYQASLTAEIDLKENPEKAGEELMNRALSIVNKQASVNLSDRNFPEKEEEVGAAWFDKKSAEKLSVQINGEWTDVCFSELEKTGDGFRHVIGKDVFVFRKIPEEKRTNKKMPIYRIYKFKGGVNE